MFLLALTAGLRQGELIALKWSDLNIKKRTLTITEKRSVERRELVEYEGGTRIVSLAPEAVELLRLEHAKHPGSPLMFMHPATQRPYSPQMVRIVPAIGGVKLKRLAAIQIQKMYNDSKTKGRVQRFEKQTDTALPCLEARCGASTWCSPRR